jgi:hypothetical protein
MKKVKNSKQTLLFQASTSQEVSILDFKDTTRLSNDEENNGVIPFDVVLLEFNLNLIFIVKVKKVAQGA